MRNTADVTGGKPIAVVLQSISGVSAINPPHNISKAIMSKGLKDIYLFIYLFAFMYTLQSLLHRCWIVIVSDIVHLPCKGVAIL
jgi:hypothetical protein